MSNGKGLQKVATTLARLQHTSSRRLQPAQYVRLASTASNQTDEHGEHAQPGAAGHGGRRGSLSHQQGRPASSPSPSSTGGRAGTPVSSSSSSSRSTSASTSSSAAGPSNAVASTSAVPSSSRGRSPTFFDAAPAPRGTPSSAHAFHTSSYSNHQAFPQSGPPPHPPSIALGTTPGTPSSSSDSPFSPSSFFSKPSSNSQHHQHAKSDFALIDPYPQPTTSSVSPSDGPHPSSSSAYHVETPSSLHAESSTASSGPATISSLPRDSRKEAAGLPSYFGHALNLARRGNLVFRNGAYGIPKSLPGSSDSSGPGPGKLSPEKEDKGKKAMTPEEEEADFEARHTLSVGVGEDAYFLRGDSLGVADGVGGWSRHKGANPARWSRKLMHHCSIELARYENVEDEMFLQYYEVDPVEILQRAFEISLREAKEEGIVGSSTALLAILRNDELRLANMGDCVCSIIRGNDYIFRSEEQQHSFNFPVQAGTNSKDTPMKDAQSFTIKVQKDDIVILSSDGLVDNLFDEDILEEVLRFVGPLPAAAAEANGSAAAGAGKEEPRYTLNLKRFSPQQVSEALCARAKSVYEDQRAVASPFQQRAMEEGIHFAGGKRDDVTTLVGVVGELEASPDRR